MGALPGPGDVLLGKYRIVGELGRGGMGIVFAAENVTTDGRVALKLLRAGSNSDPDLLERMVREGRAAARLRSRFVARVLDLDHMRDGSPVLVMERLEGRDLGAEIRTRGQLPVEEAVSYIVQACAAVAEAHALGIIHRDLKPGNLFLESSTSTTPTVRVLDFGLAKVVEAGVKDLTQPSDVLGTPAYMSPEQLLTPRSVDARADVWALGVVLYRLLTAKLPIEGRGMEVAANLVAKKAVPRVERTGVSRELADVIAQALDKTLERRWPDARVLGQALQRFLAAPSATTKLAIEELDTVPGMRSSRASMAEEPPRSVRPAQLHAQTAPTLPAHTPAPEPAKPEPDPFDDTTVRRPHIPPKRKKRIAIRRQTADEKFHAAATQKLPTTVDPEDLLSTKKRPAMAPARGSGPVSLPPGSTSLELQGGRLHTIGLRLGRIPREGLLVGALAAISLVLLLRVFMARSAAPAAPSPTPATPAARPPEVPSLSVAPPAVPSGLAPKPSASVRRPAPSP